MVARVRSLWAGETAQRNRLMAGSLAAVVVGVLLIVVGALAHWGWTRIVGATLITVGGGVLGALLGLGAPHRQQMRAGIVAQRTLIAVASPPCVLALPVILALVAAVIGLFAKSGGRGAASLAGGTVIALFLLIASLFSVTHRHPGGAARDLHADGAPADRGGHVTPTRQIEWNVQTVGQIAVYALLIIPIGFLAYGLARRVRMWRTGQPEDRFNAVGHAAARRDHQEHPARSHRPPPQPLRRRHAPDDLLGFHHAADRHVHRDDRGRHHRADLPLLVLSRELLPRLQVRHESRRVAADRRRADGLLQPARPSARRRRTRARTISSCSPSSSSSRCRDSCSARSGWRCSATRGRHGRSSRTRSPSRCRGSPTAG